MLAIMAMVAGLSLFSGQVSVRVVPPETVATTVSYDSGARRLVLGCDRATRGQCVFVVVDGAARRRLAVRPHARTMLAGVSPRARYCAAGRNPSACDWVPVSDPAS